MVEFNDMTRFERTRIISARTLQLSMGAPPLVKNELPDSKSLAMLEFEKNLLPITVKRDMPEKT